MQRTVLRAAADVDRSAADTLAVLAFVLQLGGRVALPGGVVIPPGKGAARPSNAVSPEPPRR
ncbi:MAG: hypothetical protein AB1726_13460 [Planctomycetota bacterium]